METTPEEYLASKKDNPDTEAGFEVADPLEPREGRDLVWKNVNMTLTLPTKNKDADGKPVKKILDNVWGEVPQGQITAIMGPSGSGKTSLLNILAGRARTSGNITIDADVRLNNYSVDPTDIEVRQKIAFVAQDDSLQITATPREAIRFSARLRLPKSLSDEELDKMTNLMLEELGMMDCADVLIGGALLKGISGGQRKRTSVGVELVTRPALIFLDEPTSGLDSFNAVQLCELLGKVAKAGSSVLFTIHQPSSDIFSAFDRLILLHAGRVMYQGSVTDVPKVFAEKGYAMPAHFNPADWIMKVALTSSVEELDQAGFFPEDSRDIGEPFVVTGASKKRDILGITDRHIISVDSTPGIMVQIRMLFIREVQNLTRATHALKARFAMTMMVSLVISCIFFQVAKEEYTDFVVVQSIFGAMLMALLSNMIATTFPSLAAFPAERPVFLREYSINHYSVLAYFLARLAMELFVNGVQVTVSATFTYFMVGFQSNFGMYWAALYLMACAATAMGVMIGSSVENPSVAMEFLPALFMPQILLSGFAIPPGLMPDWLAWLRWIYPLTYGVKIVMAVEFDGQCEGFPPEENYCERVTSNVGADIDDVWWYFLVMVAIFVGFRLMALKLLHSKAQKFY
eukprot:Nitzschia sp. Nitz4//scaffold217_size45653//33438//35463//NITZ4_007227-RA/size45653-processed-gene-0.21-mRNA-1//1//CDS//3329542246//7730//frame0